jgi:hypothetical protein
MRHVTEREDGNRAENHQCGTAELNNVEECEKLSRVVTPVCGATELSKIEKEYIDGSQEESPQCSNAELINMPGCVKLSKAGTPVFRNVVLGRYVIKCGEGSQAENPQCGTAELNQKQSAADVTSANDDDEKLKCKCLKNELRSRKYLKLSVDGQPVKLCREHYEICVTDKNIDPYNESRGGRRKRGARVNINSEGVIRKNFPVDLQQGNHGRPDAPINEIRNYLPSSEKVDRDIRDVISENVAKTGDTVEGVVVDTKFGDLSLATNTNTITVKLNIGISVVVDKNYEQMSVKDDTVMDSEKEVGMVKQRATLDCGW